MAMMVNDNTTTATTINNIITTTISQLLFLLLLLTVRKLSKEVLLVGVKQFLQLPFKIEIILPQFE